MFSLRLKFIAAAVFVMMAAVIARLGYMQLVMTEYYREEGRKRQIRVYYPDAPRGLIVARDGTILAEDRPVLSVCLVFKDFNSMTSEEVQNWYASVADIVDDSPENVAAKVQRVYNSVEAIVDRRVARIRAKANETPDRLPDKRLAQEVKREAEALRRGEYTRKKILYDDITWEQAAKAEVASVDLPGLAVGEAMERRYPQGQLAAHTVGYVNESSDDEIELYGADYNGNTRKRVVVYDVMGRAGTEAQYNYDLKGNRGEVRAIVNAHNQKQMILSDERPEAGTTITLTIDPLIQAAAEKGLAAIFGDYKDPRGVHHPGAAVCMNVRTGEILAIASSPSYDPNTFSDDYSALVDPAGLGKYHPLQNRTIAGAYPLGSVFKIITTTAGLESGATSPGSVFTCNGVYHLGRGEWRCSIWNPQTGLSHGSLDLSTALKVSCNVYFYNVGVKVGGGPLSLWASRYGIGHPTGVDLPGESAGVLGPAPNPGDAVNLAIGQGALAVTPVQVCRMLAAVANGGKLVTPHIYSAREVPMADPIGVSPATLAVIRQGLYRVVNESGGTAYKVGRTDVMAYAAKTGTAQNPPHPDHAWFAGFAPFDNPEIAFAVVIENGGHGGVAAAPVGKAIVEAYAAGKLAAAGQPLLAATAPAPASAPKITEARIGR